MMVHHEYTSYLMGKSLSLGPHLLEEEEEVQPPFMRAGVNKVSVHRIS